VDNFERRPLVFRLSLVVAIFVLLAPLVYWVRLSIWRLLFPVLVGRTLSTADLDQVGIYTLGAWFAACALVLIQFVATDILQKHRRL